MRRGILYSPERGFHHESEATKSPAPPPAAPASGRHFVILQGCEYGCSGGGQRPTQIARALARLGERVTLYSSVEQANRMEDGLRLVGGVTQDLSSEVATAHLATVVVTLPLLFTHARPLIEAGATLAYDMIDNWAGFRVGQDLAHDQTKAERELIAAADVVTVSALTLKERAESLGAKRVVVIPNGGPEDLLPASVPPSDMALGPIRVVYLGSLFGSWLDWELLERVNAESDFALTVIGKREGPWKEHDLHYVGEKPQAEAYRYLASADVGIIPFRGWEICKYVWPIKAADYWAAGLYVVTTPEVQPLFNANIGHWSAYTHGASPDGFCSAIREVAAKRESEPVGREWVRGHSWSARARQFVEVDRALGLRPSSRASTYCERQVRWGEDNMRVGWQAPATCNMQPLCPGCCTETIREGKPPIGCDPEALLQGWFWLEKKYGPLCVSVAMGEPFADAQVIEIIGHLARRNRVEVSTNLLTPVEDLARLPRNDNVGIATSFHPHAWDDVDDFIAKRKAVEATGLRVGWASIYGYPPDLPHLEEWQARMRAEGITCLLQPFSGWWQYKHYPESYTPEEWAIFEHDAQTLYGEHAIDYAHAQGPGKGTPCYTGTRRYCFVSHSSDIWRCYMGDAEPIGNLCRRKLRLVEGPTPCPSEACSCPDMWGLVEPSEGI